MKPIQIVLLAVAAALGGAIVMKLAQPSQPIAPQPALAQTLAPPPTAPPTPSEAPPAAPAAAPTPAPAARPTPFAPLRHAPPPATPAEPEPVPPAPIVSTPPTTPPVVPEVSPARTEPENVTPPPSAPPEPHRVTLNAGTLIPVRLVDGLSAERNQPGDPFTATLDNELVADGFVIAERGARVEGRVVRADRGARLQGVSSLEVELTSLHLSDGQIVNLHTDPFARRTNSSRQADAERIGTGAILGAVLGTTIGGAAAGGKGAAIGAGVGGAAGAGAAIATHNKPAALPSETRLTFRVRATLTITERTATQ